jgi:hypothetical protein
VQTVASLESGFGLEPGSDMNPHQPGELIEEHARLLCSELAGQRRDLRMLADRAATRRWLKRHRQLLREAGLYGDSF